MNQWALPHWDICWVNMHQENRVYNNFLLLYTMQYWLRLKAAELFEAIVEEKVRYIRGRIEDLENDKNLSEIEKIDLIIEAYVDRFLSYPDFHKVMEQEMLVSQRKDLHKKVIEIVTQNINNFTKIIEKGIRKKVFKKVDAPLLFASIIGTINQVLKSKQICCVYIFRESNKDFNPYSDEHFRKRLVTHIQQMVHSTLLQS